MTDSLRTGRALTMEGPVRVHLGQHQGRSRAAFRPKQYMEMPYYNQAFFDQLTHFEFLLHAMPAGRVQLMGLEVCGPVRTPDARAQQRHPGSVVDRLWQALGCNLFQRRVVKRLARQLESLGEEEDARGMFAWAERLDAVSTEDNQSTFERCFPGACSTG